MTDLSEISLMQEIAADSRPAFSQLFLRYYSRLCSFADSMLRDNVLAEEVVSEVFFTIWRTRKTINIQSNLKAYLFTCVRNEALRIAKQKKLMTLKSDDDDPEYTCQEYNPHESLEFKELVNNVNSAIDTLPEKCRQFFTLSRFDGLKYNEIAQLYDVSEKTVENQIVKALKILRERILKKSNRYFISH